MKGILRESNNDAAVQFFIKLDCFQHAIFGNQDFMYQKFNNHIKRFEGEAVA
jgi:hypothetical protein